VKRASTAEPRRKKGSHREDGRKGGRDFRNLELRFGILKPKETFTAETPRTQGENREIGIKGRLGTGLRSPANCLLT
jgi:hypothetical protein